MQSTSTTYRNLLANATHNFGVQLNIGGIVYGEDKILSARISSRVFESEPTIGGVYSSTLEFSLILPGSVNIARMANVTPQFRAQANGSNSTWYSKGTYYIDTRDITQNDSGIYIFKAYCYDAMLKANADYATSSLSWPATDLTVVGEIATKMGVTVDSRTTSLLNKGYTIPTVPIGYTLRDVLSFIAVMYGGNWIMTDTNKLRFLPIEGGTDTLSVGKSAASLSVSPTRSAYTKLQVSLSEDTDEVIESGSSDDRVMTAVCPFMTQAIANTVFISLSAFQYKPFTANGVWSDPAVELGDIVTINGFTGPAFAIDTTLGSGMVMDMSAPNDNYIDHEYAYESPAARSYKKTMGQMSTSITQNSEDITLTAEKLNNIGGRNYAWAISADYHTPTTLSYVTSTYNPDNNGEYVVTATRAGASDQNSPQTYTKNYPVPSELLGTECIFHVDSIDPSNSATNPQVGLLLYDSSDTLFFVRYLQSGTMSRVITIPTTAATMRIDIFVDANKVNAVGDNVTVRGIKLERGTVATDWSPAPEDQAGYADHTASAQITVAANEIRGEVSETYETKADASVVNLMPSVYYREANSENPWESPSGITWTVKPDGSIVATGTATAESTYSIANSSMSALVPPIKVDPTRDYTISGVPGVTGCRIYFVKYDASGTQIGSQGYIQNAPSAVISAGADYISCFAYIVSGTALPEGGVTFRPQLEVGTTAHGYISTHNGSYSMQSQIVQNATEISSKVSTTDYTGSTIASLINQSPDTVYIEAQHINLNGVVTANNNVQILTDGTIKAVNADISGKFTMTGGSINIETDSASDNRISLNYYENTAFMSANGFTAEYVNENVGGSAFRNDFVSDSIFMQGVNQASTPSETGEISIDNLNHEIYVAKDDAKGTLTPSGLTFRNSSGTVTAQYPADNSTIRKASSGSSTSMTTGTATKMVSIVLDPGVWVMSYMQGFANNATGYRTAYLTTNASSTSVSQSLHAAATTIMPVSGVTTYAHLTATTRVTAQTTVYGYAIQTSGGNLSGTGYINAVRIA